MNGKLLRQLNGRLVAELGRNPSGGNNFRWTRTDSDIATAYEDTGFEEKKSPAGVVYFETAYRTFKWAEIHGLRWCMAKWRAWDREEWIASHGTQLPWPRHGEYEIYGGIMPEGEEPDDKTTTAIVHFIRLNLQMTAYDHEQEALVKLKLKAKAEKAQTDDEIDDDWVAFNHMPGTRGGHVSLPTKEYREKCEVVNG